MRTKVPKIISSERQYIDPDTQPWLGPCNLAPLDASKLTVDFIRTAFEHTEQVQWQVEPFYTHAFIQNFTEHPQSIQSAVCVAIAEQNSELYVIFTRRSESLLHHPGQVSFPGGRVDVGDSDAIAAALRETHEEVGIAPQYIEPLAEQPIFLTNTQFAMRPVISLLHPGYQLRPNPGEVAEIFTVPLSELMNPRRHQIHRIKNRSLKEGVYFSIHWQGRNIWGATAAVVRNLYHYLSAAEKQLSA